MSEFDKRVEDEHKTHKYIRQTKAEKTFHKKCG